MCYTIIIIDFTFSYNSGVSPNTMRGIDILEYKIFQYEWDIPNDVEVCCSQYRVVTPNGTVVNTSERSFKLYNGSDAAFNISVSCIDMLGTSGTPAFLPAHEVVSKC